MANLNKKFWLTASSI